MKRIFGRSISILFVTIMAAAASVACGSKVNQANFDKIQNEMTQEEVQKILGPPTETSGVSVGAFSGNSATWKSGESVISIQYLNGKVVAKQFVKSPDSSPGANQETR